jgi:redox-sensitive bicupin YhaK (pirin superfamily)
LGHGETLRPGELQRMTAGTGIRHSEFNPSDSESVHLYQVWILPREAGLAPSYEQKAFDPANRANRWQLVASPDGAEGSLTIQQNGKIFLANLGAGQELQQAIGAGRHAWLQVLRGSVKMDSVTLETSDGLAVSAESLLNLHAASDSELMLFDLP